MLNGEKLIDRPLRWGMVGGGRTGQVGYKHRTGALRDNTAYKMYRYAAGSCPRAAEASARVVSLPLHMSLNEEDVRRVAAALGEICS